MTKLGTGNNTAGQANVDSNFNLQVNLPYTTPAGVEIGGGNEAAGAVIFLSENDNGEATGVRSVLAPETDSDFRLRVGIETQLDDETFNYTAQNTGKFTYQNTTMTNTWNTSGFLTNGSGITTTTTGTTFGTYAYFPLFGGGIITYIQFKGALAEQPTANTIIDAGAFIRSVANPYTPTDGVYFRFNSSGVLGVVNHNGTETTTATLPFTYTNYTSYQFLITLQEDKVRFWIDDVLYGEIPTPIAQGQPCMASALPFSVRHAITGGVAGGIQQFRLRDYNISLGGVPFSRTLAEVGNSSLGSYQGTSGGTMGSLASYANSANPTAAVPTNTTSTVLTALGGQGWETDTLAVNTDGIIMSYQIPGGTVSLAGKRLKLISIKIDSYVQTALTGGGYNAQFSLAFGHTAVSLATAEAASAKAPRRIPLGSYSVASGLAVLTQLPTIFVDFIGAEVYVNPGEFIAIAKKKVGTAPSLGVIAYTFTPKYAWE